MVKWDGLCNLPKNHAIHPKTCIKRTLSPLIHSEFIYVFTKSFPFHSSAHLNIGNNVVGYAYIVKCPSLAYFF
jgi:hypothetical protein